MSRRLMRTFSAILIFLLAAAFSGSAWALPGDINESGRVDGFDLIRFSKAFGSNVDGEHWNPQADFNADGVVDDSDLAILRDYFGKTGLGQNCWVADERHSQLVKLAGGTGEELVRTSSGALNYPKAVWADPFDGSVWAADTGNGAVVFYDARGLHSKKIDGFTKPYGISVDPIQNVVWVADRDGNRVIRLMSDAPDGYDISTDTGHHAIIMGFYYPEAIAVNPTDGSCWVAEIGNDRVVKLTWNTPDGYDCSAESGYHFVVAGFSDPSSVSVNSVTGDCWVADKNHHQVVKLTAGGFEELRISGFYYPASVSVNPLTGDCWVADTNNSEVVRLSPLGAELVRVGGFNNPRCVSVDMTTNNCWVSDTYNSQVVKLAVNGTELLRTGGFYYPSGLAAVPPEQGDEPPSALAGVSSTHVAVGESVTFDGSGSTDHLHDIIRYEWDFDGDGVFDEVSSTPVASHSYDQAGMYTGLLRVTNSLWLVDTAQTSVIRVGELTAVTSADPASGAAPLNVTFTFNAIDPVDGRVETFFWDFDGDGVFESENSSPGTISHEYNEAGTFPATLKVVDNGNVTVTTSIEITVEPAPPSISISANPVQGASPLQVDFTVNGSDPDGEIMFYEWDFDGDGQYDWFNHSSGNASFVYPLPGHYTARVRVTDNDGNQAEDERGIDVSLASEKYPTAQFTADPVAGNAPMTVSFDATASTTPQGAITEYRWDFGDNSTGSGISPSHEFATEGTYTVQLTVVNDMGGISSAARQVDVLAGGMPTAVAGADVTSGTRPFTVTFSAAGSHDDPNEVNGGIVSYEWNFGLPLNDFQDDMESGDGMWTAEPTWARTTADSHSGQYCWTDSPDGNYTSGSNGALTHSPADFSDYAAPITLSFWHRGEFESGYDNGLVEVSVDGGNAWEERARFTSSWGWSEARVSLDDYAGQSDVRIRFRIVADYSVFSDGWYVDDVRVEGALFQDATATSGTVSQAYDQPGTYHPILRVTDADGNTATDTLTVEVTEGYPVAAFTASPAIGPAPLTVNFSSAASQDPNGTVARFQWDFDNSFADDAEGDGSRWNVQSPWAITDADAHSGTHCWTDSPGGDFADYADTALTTTSLDMSTADSPVMKFWHRYSFTWNSSGRVEVSSDGGTTWDELKMFDSQEEQATWKEVTVDLSAYAGEPDVRVRFRLVNASYYNDDGWYIDDILITGGEGSFDSELENPVHTYTQPGVYYPLLKVTDNDGNTAITTQKVVANHGEPIAVAAADPESGLVPLTVNFSSDGSSDPNGTITAFYWDFIGEFQDDMENGGGNWVAQSPWAITDEDAHSGRYCWTDSPGGNYAGYSNVALTSRVLDLSASTQPSLVFWHRHSFSSYAGGKLEASTDGGTNWTELSNYQSTSAWKQETVDLSGLAGLSHVMIRFRLENTYYYTNDGWYIDDVAIEGYVAAAVSSAANPTYTYTAPGLYHPTLQVTDDDGYQDQDVLTLLLKEAPSAFIEKPADGGLYYLQDISFIGIGTDRDGSVVLYEWDFDGDGNYDWSSTDGGDARHSYAETGDYTPVLRVVDNDGYVSTASVSIHIEETVPADFELSVGQSRGYAPYPVTFSGAATDADGDILQYEWDFNGDGTIDWGSAGPGRLIDFTSQYNTSTGAADKLIDGTVAYNIGWISVYKPTYPQEFTFELAQGKTWQLDRLVISAYVPEDTPSRPRRVEILVSNTDLKVSSFESLGRFDLSDSLADQVLSFSSIPARYLKLRVLSNYGSTSHIKIGEVSAFSGIMNVLSPLSAQVSFVYEAGGTYSAVLYATDDEGNRTSGSVDIDVFATNTFLPHIAASPAQGFTPQTVQFNGILSDDFSSDGIGSQWLPATGNGTWVVENGVMKQTSGSGSYTTSTIFGTCLISSTTEWADGSFSVDMQTPDRDSMGLVFRYQDNDHYYLFEWNRYYAYRRLVKRVPGNIVELAREDGVAYEMDQWYTIRAEASGDNLEIYIDDALALSAADPDYPSGRAGIWCNYNAGTQFDNAEVTLPGATYAWDVDGVPGVDSTSAAFTYTYDVPGVYPVHLEISDGNATAADSMDLPVLPKGDGLTTVWVADTNHDKVLEYVANGSNLIQIREISGFSYPWRVAVNPEDGSAWVLDKDRDQVYRISPDAPDGYNISTGTGFHTVFASWYDPIWIAFDGNGSAWVADRYNDRIVKIPTALSGYVRRDFSGSTPSVVSQINGADILGAASTTAGHTGNAVLLGDGHYLSLPAESLDGLADFTVEAWFSRTVTHEGAVLSGARPSYYNEFLLYIRNSTTIQIHLGGTSRDFPVSGIDLNDGTFHHVAVTRTGDQVTVFVDGDPAGVQTFHSNPINVAESGLIVGQEQDSLAGGFQGTQQLEGAVDELRIWSAARTEAQIETDMDRALTGTEANLSGYWPMDAIEGPRATFVTVSGFSDPVCVDVNPADGTVWVADPSADKVFRVSADVADGYDLSVDTDSHQAFQGYDVYRLAVRHSDGTCWVADSYYDRVVVFAGDGSGEIRTIGGFDNPNRIAVNQQDGSIWVSDYYRDQVVHLTHDGSREIIRTGGFSQVEALDVDSATGQCWISDIGRDDIQRLAPDGTVLSSQGGLYDPQSLAVKSAADSPLNVDPPVIATADVSKGYAAEGETVDFTAAVSDNGSIRLYEWDFDGDGSVDYQSESSPDASYAYSRFGIYQPVLRVVDDQGLVSCRLLDLIHIGETRAILSAQPLRGYAPLSVHFEGDGFDPDSRVASYSWDFTSDGSVDRTDRVYNFTYNEPGLYRATLIIDTEDGKQAAESVLIEVLDAPPTATAAASQNSGYAPLAVELSGTASDPDGNIAVFQWDYNGDGVFDWNSRTESSVWYTYPENGTYEAMFRVVDNDGLEATDTVIITVSTPPTAQFAADPVKGNAPLSVTVDASASGDPDSGQGLAYYEWDFGDGTYGDGVEATHIYEAAGTYTITLIVTDSLGTTTQTQSLVEVKPAASPLAVAAAAPVDGIAPLSVNFSAAGSTDDNGIVRYEWDFGEGDVLSDNGYPLHQLFLGPWEATGCEDVSSMQSGILDTLPLEGESFGGHEWTAAYDGDGNFDWNSIFGGDYRYGYSHIYLFTPEARTVQIRFGSDDAARFWVNGELAYSKNVCEGVSIDKYSFTVDLLAGWNRILASVSDGYSGWGLAYRFTDPDGNPLRLAYSLKPLDSDPDFYFSSEIDGNTTHTYQAPGVYEAELTVTDADGNTDSETVVITVDPFGPPTAHAAATPDSGDNPLTVAFHGTGTDANGTLVRYEWDFDGDGAVDWSSATSGETDHLYTTVGSYEATLRVTDDDGLSATDSVTITVGLPPEARPFVYPLSGQAPLTVNFVSNGIDPDGTVEQYVWDLDGDGQTESLHDLNGDGWADNPSMIPTAFPFTFTTPGTYPSTLTVIDNNGLRDSATVEINVQPPEKPTAEAVAMPDFGSPPLGVTFMAYGSVINGTIAAYHWDFGDQTTATGQQVSHVYDQSGNYTVRLTITDNLGAAATDEIHVRVKEPDCPTADASVVSSSGESSLTVSFAGSGLDTGGSIVLYEWDFDGDGEFDYSSTESGDTVYNYTEAGQYEAVLRVTDNDGNQDIDYLSIDVGFGIKISRADEILDPTMGESAGINYSLTAAADLTLRIIDRGFTTVRTVFQNVAHTAGAYSSEWDGMDDDGQRVPDGVYYFILDYTIDGVTKSVDLIGDVSLQRQTPSKDYPSSFNTLEDRPLFAKFSLGVPSETTIYVAKWIGGVGDRVKTIYLREPLPSGSYVTVWDGTDDEGRIAPVDTYVWSVLAYDLPENALIVSSRPVIEDLSKEPDFFMPAANPYSDSPGAPLTVSFRLSKPAAVEGFVKNENDVTVRTLTAREFNEGSNQITWDGRDDNGHLVYPGVYRMGLQATDAQNNRSDRAYSLFRVFY